MAMNFNGYLNLQKEHLLDLGNNSKLGDSEAATAISTIQGQLDGVANSYKETDKTTRDILTHQDEITDMVNQETGRLAVKKKNIDDSLEGQKRMIMLNESYRMKYSHYLKMVLTVLTVTILFIIIKVLSSKVPGIPGAVWDLILIIVFSLAIIYIYYLWSDMRRRDNMNFNKLFFMTPEAEKAGKPTLAKGGSSTKVSLWDAVKSSATVCSGDDCCAGSEMQYNSENNTCELVGGFGNMGVEEPASVNNLVKPTDPDEYTNYGKYL
jgi:hypothetical protein